MMALGLGMATMADAQSTPAKGDITAEIGFTPFKSSGESFKLNEGMFKVRYFLTDKDVVRVKLGVGIDNTTNTQTSFTDAADKTQPYTISNSSTETKSKYSNFSFALGYERHLKTVDRLDVYVGAEFGYGTDSYSGEETSAATSMDYANGKLDETCVFNSVKEYTDRNAAGNRSSHYFTGSVFTGIDFYVYKNLYMGVELGINFKSGKSPNSFYTENSSMSIMNASGVETYSQTVAYSQETGTTVTVTKQGNTVNTDTQIAAAVSNESTTTNLKFYVEPAIRLGWRF